MSDNNIVSLQADSLQKFLAQAYAAPMLTKEQEFFYAAQFKLSQDSESLRQLILPHLRFVIHIAKRYQNFGVQLADLIQEGIVGLIKAVHKFDADFGVRLSSFAIHWIKSAIHEYILKNWRLVKIATTKAQRKLFFNLHRFLKDVGSLSKDEVKFIADNLAVSEKEVKTMEQRLKSDDASIDFEVGEEQSFAKIELKTQKNHDPANQIEMLDLTTKQNQFLKLALSKLKKRPREIIALRFLQDKKANRNEIAEMFKISAERVRQIENQALKDLKSYLSSNTKDVLPDGPLLLEQD